MVIVKKSATADSRTCDAANVSIEVLKDSTISHKFDVNNTMHFFSHMLGVAASKHDNHKLETIEAFHNAFVGKFADVTWWNEHKKERHHLPADLDDVNLIDILEHIADCVAAGMARTGKVFVLKVDDAMLQKAFQNTVKLLIDNIKIEE